MSQANAAWVAVAWACQWMRHGPVHGLDRTPGCTRTENLIGQRRAAQTLVDFPTRLKPLIMCAAPSRVYQDSASRIRRLPSTDMRHAHSVNLTSVFQLKTINKAINAFIKLAHQTVSQHWLANFAL